MLSFCALNSHSTSPGEECVPYIFSQIAISFLRVEVL